MVQLRSVLLSFSSELPALLVEGMRALSRSSLALLRLWLSSGDFFLCYGGHGGRGTPSSEMRSASLPAREWCKASTTSLASSEMLFLF